MSRKVPKLAPRTVQLAVRIPPNCNDQETIEYCLAAINSWGGSLRPSHSFFDGCETVSASSSATRFVLRKDSFGNMNIVRKISKRRPK